MFYFAVLLSLIQVSAGMRTKWETKDDNRGVPVVYPLPNKAGVYECRMFGHDLTSPTYTWFRQDSSSLPDGVRAEGNRLYVMKSTSDLNGLYHCNITNKQDTYSASVYIEIQDSTLYWILKKALALLALGDRKTTHTVKF